MSKIFDEMREVAQNPESVSNKTLLQFIVVGLVDVNDRVEKLLDSDRKRNGEMAHLVDDIEELKEKSNRNLQSINSVQDSVNIVKKELTEATDELRGTMESIRKNTLVKVGSYLEKHPKVALAVFGLIVLLFVHVFGSLGGVLSVFEDLMKLFGLVL